VRIDCARAVLSMLPAATSVACTLSIKNRREESTVPWLWCGSGEALWCVLMIQFVKRMGEWADDGQTYLFLGKRGFVF